MFIIITEVGDLEVVLAKSFLHYLVLEVVLKEVLAATVVFMNYLPSVVVVVVKSGHSHSFYFGYSIILNQYHPFSQHLVALKVRPKSLHPLVVHSYSTPFVGKLP